MLDSDETCSCILDSDVSDVCWEWLWFSDGSDGRQCESRSNCLCSSSALWANMMLTFLWWARASSLSFSYSRKHTINNKKLESKWSLIFHYPNLPITALPILFHLWSSRGIYYIADLFYNLGLCSFQDLQKNNNPTGSSFFFYLLFLFKTHEIWHTRQIW